MASLPTKYLGTPLGAKNKDLEIWSKVLKISERNLSRWKSQYLSLGGGLYSHQISYRCTANLHAEFVSSTKEH